jgi:hypothetical protein
MPINSFLPYRAYNGMANSFKAKGRPRKRWREDIKNTLQQHGLTINDATRQARARSLKTPRHQIRRVQQPLPSLVTQLRNDDD